MHRTIFEHWHDIVQSLLCNKLLGEVVAESGQHTNQEKVVSYDQKNIRRKNIACGKLRIQVWKTYYIW